MIRDLVKKLKNREYRDAFVESHVRNGIAFQLRSMRNARGWDQKKLAAAMGNAKLQPVISRYENPDYGKYSLETLLKLARAFDVGLIVRFGRFSELMRWDDQISEENLNIPSFEQEMQQTAKPAVLPYITATADDSQPAIARTFLKQERTINPTIAAALAHWETNTPEAELLDPGSEENFVHGAVIEAAKKIQVGVEAYYA